MPKSNKDKGHQYQPPKGIVNREAIIPKIVKYKAIKYVGSVSLNLRIEIATIEKNIQNKISPKNIQNKKNRV